MTGAGRFVSAALAGVTLTPLPATAAVFDEDVFAHLLQAYGEHRAKYRPLAEFKVTKAQLDELCALVPIVSDPYPPMPLVFGIPVRLVDTFEESTVFEQWRDRYVAELKKAAAEREPIEFFFDTFGPYRFESTCWPRWQPSPWIVPGI